MTITEAHELGLERSIVEGCTACDAHLTCSHPNCNCRHIPVAVRIGITAYLAAKEAGGFVMMPTAIMQEMREAVRKDGGDGAVGWANAIYPDLIAARPRVTP